MSALASLRGRIKSGELPPEASVRFRVRHADGTWRWLESVIADLSDVPGVEASIVFSRDVTEAEQHRAELAEARASAEKQAELLGEHDRARNDFVLSVSHELRTPLTSLISGAELLLDGTGPPLDDATRDTVEILYRNANRLRRLIENLLLVSRLQTGMEDLVPTEVDVARLIGTALDVARPKAVAREVEFSADVEPGPTVIGDRQQLAAVLDNVVGNAVKYTDPGTTVSVVARPGDGGWVIDVRDARPRGQRRVRRSRSSVASPAGRPRSSRTPRAPAWAWRSPARSWGSTAALSPSSPRTGPGRRSGSSSRSAASGRRSGEA